MVRSKYIQKIPDKPKFLIIRFSSIGDIIQCMGVISGIRTHFPDAEIHWITRKDMVPLLGMDPRIHKIWAFDKATGLRGLLLIAKQLRKECYDFIYDAHSNIRSNILKLTLSPIPGCKPYIALRGKKRWKRFLLFHLRINRFNWPFRGVDSYREPLKKWGISSFPDITMHWRFPETFQSKWKGTIGKTTITLIPSANWEMKRWPVQHWQRLITLLPTYRFVLLGGLKDTFCQEIQKIAPERVKNLVGKTNLAESCYLVSQSHIVVSADTGFMHAADMFRISTLALIGPTAFGFPCGPTAEVLETDLSCRPCTKDGSGRCSNKTYRKCMINITPERVAKRIRELFPLECNCSV